jgi:hypothetical protein
VRFLSIAALTTALGYLPFGTVAVRAVAGSLNRTSRASVWSPISRALHHPVGGVALVMVVVLSLVAASRLRSHPLPALAVVGTIAAYLFAGPYVLPWYAAWALPAAALARRSWIAVLVAAHAAFLVAAYEFPRNVVPGSFDAVGRAVSLTPLAVVALVVFAVLLVRSGISRLTPRSHDHPR